MNKSEKIDSILAWIETQKTHVAGDLGHPPIQIPVRLKADTEKDALLIRKLFLRVLPGLSLNSPRKGTNPKYDGNQKWFIYGDMKITTDGQQIKRRRRSDVGKKRVMK